uniref:Cytosol aminopeptidase domain-containing protein n=1 Tax=Phaeomonas parva TaxID=124430 RepID=A0A7S1TP27_9STRA|mmetsp:Transcript_10036/g.29683  ORF Transcript_10036/g.29683 Transcript_10036/m.29683 type:complete len:610 (+) Transcript_10036:207-2036(+)
MITRCALMSLLGMSMLCGRRAGALGLAALRRRSAGIGQVAALAARTTAASAARSWTGTRGGGVAMNMATIAGAELDAELPMLTEGTKLEVTADSSVPETWAGDILIVPVFAEPKAEDAAEGEETEEEEEEGDDAEAAPAFELPAGSVAATMDSQFDGLLSEVIEEMEWKAKAGSTAWTRAPKGSPAKKVVLYGLGQAGEKCNSEAMQKLGKYVATFSKSQKAVNVGVVMPAVGDEGTTSEAPSKDLVTGLLNAFHSDSRYKSSKAAKKAPKLESVALLGGSDEEIAAASGLWSGVQLARDLVSAPANVVTPTSMAQMAETLAKEVGFECEILDTDEILERKMGAYYGVAKGAVHPPKFIHLTYKPEGEVKKKVCIVGKGLTFDSGGYNLKVGASMIELMKFDMGGSGAVFGAAKAIGELKPAGVEVHFVVAACENMVSDTAMRPGDILTASNGKTIEVINTDAEGRLTLADALVFAEDLEVDRIVDLATLTGACIVSLGNSYAGMWSSDDDFAGEIEDAAKASGEKMWRMPLAQEYAPEIKSKIADLKNVGGRAGGSITAALFLKQFVKKTPWAHIDMAGPVWDNKAGTASGYGVKTLVSWVEGLGKEE